MSDYNIIHPSQPRIVSEEGDKGIFEIDGLYRGYGHTLGNSLRRIILSSLPGAAMTSLKIDGVPHEFSTIDGIKEDVITIILNLKRVRYKLLSDEPQTVTLKVSGAKKITAADITTSGQVEVLNPDQYICELTDKKASLDCEMVIEQGLGFVSKEMLQKEKVDIGTIAVDAIFTPIRRVHYEVEDMRVGDRTDFNRLRIIIETDGTVAPSEALEESIRIMINQLKAIVGFQEEEDSEEIAEAAINPEEETTEDDMTEIMKTRIDTLKLSTRTLNALDGASIRTIGGLVRKSKEDLLALEGLGEKGLQEIKRAVGEYGIILKDE